ncbi:MAG: choice-of-anchor D domain-containing protein [Marinifilaceae bacterium]
MRQLFTLFKSCLLAVFLFTAIHVSAQTTLTDGDIVFTRINRDGNDAFSFLVLTDIANGTIIYFSDEYWDGTEFTTDYNTIKFTATSDIAAGDEVHISDEANPPYAKSTSGTVTANFEEIGQYTTLGEGGWMKSNGDNILAFQGSILSPTFIAGICSSSGKTGTSGNAWNYTNEDQGTQLPSGRTNGQGGYLGLFPNPATEIDNARYKTSALHSGDKATLLAAIMNLSNWEFNNDIAFSASTTTFTVEGGNTAPTATAPSAPTVLEDATNVALADDIQVADTDGDDQTVTFTITGGTLTIGTTGITFGGNLNGSASFTASGTLAAINSALDAATFTPTPNLSGTNAGTIAFTTNDGTADSNTASVSFDITAENDAPTASDFTITSIKDYTTTFTAANFGYSDLDGDALVKIVVNSIPSEGYLYYDVDDDDAYDTGEAIGNGAVINKTDLDEGKLQYYNDNGASTSFEFAVHDGTAYSLSSYTATLNVLVLPTVTTQAVSSITATTATGKGNITALGTPNPTAHGVCWSTSENPTTANSKDDKGAASATGEFTASITGVSARTTYYVRAFATNDAGTVYGNQVSFATPPTLDNRTFNNVHKGLYYPYMSLLFEDYKDEAGDGNSLQNIRILTLPAHGTLFLDITDGANGIIDDGEAITVDQEIHRNYLLGGALRYLNTDGVNSSFTYVANDGTNDSNTATVTLNIIPTPTVTFTSETQSSSEATETITITAQLSETLNQHQVTLPFSVDNSSTATGGGTDYSITESPITFGFAETSKTIVITVNNDALDEGDETIVVNMGTPTNADQGATTQHTATITDDDDAPTIAFNTASSEGLESVSSANLQVNLSAQSGLPVSVNYSVSGSATRTGADCILADGTLNFAAGETSKNITIASIVSNLLDEDDETVIVTLSSPTNATLGGNKVHTYTILDDDPSPTIAFTSTSSNGLESVSSADLQVDLSAESGLEVTVDYTVTGGATGGGTDYTLANGNLAIAAGTTAKNITIASIVNDVMVEGNETVVVTLSNPDNATLGTNTVHTYTITDDDTAGFTLVQSEGTTSVGEPNTTDSFTAVLDAQPVSDVVLNVVSGDTGEATVDKASLTFTNANWDTPQTVTVTAADDKLIDGDQSTTITISVNDAGSDNNFDALEDQTVSVSTTDNDVAGFTLSKTTATITESGTDDFFTVVLDAQPISDVVLNIANGSTDEATIDKVTLTFTNGNWNTPQTVTITPVDDYLDDGDQPITLTISVDAGGSDNDFDALSNQTVSVSSTDNDTAGFTLSKLSASVEEPGTEDSFTAVLTAQPTSDVVLKVSSSDESEVSVAPATLTFTSENWNTAQTVIVTGVDDAYADGNQSATLSVSVDDANSDNAFDGVADQNVSCTITDNEEVGFTLWENDAYTAVKESGTTDVFTVVLEGPPASDVVLNVVSGDTGEVTVDKASLTFTNSNWNSAQVVTVTGVDDVVAEGTQITAITISVDDASSDDAFDALEDQIIKTTTIDDDGPGITVIETNGSTIGWERGKIDTIWVNLNSMPTSDVVFSFARANSEEIDIEFLEYQFEVTEWNEPRAFRIAGVNDDVVDGDVTVPLTIGIVDEKSDIAYRDFADIVINAINIDNEIASFSVWKTTALVDESGTSDSFTVKLDAEPLSDVVFNVSSGDTDEVTVDKSTLTFTNANWSTKQTVTVTGVNDNLADGSQTTDITISVNAASSQDLFDGLEDQTVSVTTTDDDANFTLSKTTASVAESGITDEFTVVLNGAPSSDVVLSVTSGDTGEATVDQATLTFTSGNWNSPQKVTVTGANDILVDGNQSSTITLSVVDGSSDAAFATAMDQTVTCTTIDDDVAGFTLAETDGGTEVSETGTTDTYTVVLDAQPLSNVVLNVVSGDVNEVTVDKASLTFTNTNWNTPQTVTVTGVNDYLIDGSQSSVITIGVNAASSNDAFDGVLNQIVNVSTTDDDVAGFTLAETDGGTTVSEAGTTDTYTVVLDAQPVSDVVLTISSGDTDEVTVDLTTLTFTNANWNTPQTVTVTGIDDFLTDGDQSTLVTLSVDDANSDNAFDALSDQTVSVITVDDDLREINVQYSGIDLSDGSTVISEALGTDFGDLDIAEGSRDRTFTILNTGETDLEVSSINLSDSGSGFGLSGITLPTSVAAGESTTFVVSFDPAVTGSKSVTVAIGNNDSDENPFDFQVSGTGTARPVMAVQGNSVLIADDSESPSEGNGTHWGNCSVGQVITKNFVIENKGSAKLNLSGTPIVSISGSSRFAVSEQPQAAVVEVGGKVNFSVRYTSDCTTGVHNATVSIANDDVSIYNFKVEGVSIDDVAPLASTRDTVLQLDGDGVASLLTADVDNGSTDNCTIASMTLNQTSFDCSQLGENILTFTLVDASGNKTVSEVTVTIEDPHTIALGDLADVCLNAEKLELPAGNPAGGSYSGPGVSEGMFDPVEAGEGVHKITYSVSDNGCASSVVRELTVWPLPEVNLAAFAKDTMQLDEEQVILPQGIPVGGYYFGEGVTGIRFDPSLAGTGVHNIYYAIRDENNCYNFDLTEIVVVNILDIHSVEDGDEVLIFPNPNHGEFFVETNEKCTMRVFNNQGGLVLSKEIHSGDRTKVTMNHLASGVYLIQLTTKTNVINKRVVIQR